MSWYRSMEGSKVNTHRHHIRNDLWPLDYPSSWHCKCMNLYIFWMRTLVWLIWAQFHPNRMILKIWPLCKRSLTFILFFPLSWQRNIVWISCNDFFYSLWLEEEFEIYINLIGIFLSFIPIYPLTLDFMVNMVFENASHVYLKVRTFLCILIYEFPNTNKMGTGLQNSLLGESVQMHAVTAFSHSTWFIRLVCLCQVKGNRFIQLYMVLRNYDIPVVG